jgi:uncharacterized damage-inducible protein DinB
MDNAKWFERKFDFDSGTDNSAAVYNRLQQAPETVKNTVLSLPEDVLVFKPDGKWSIKEHTGHLSMLEPIWRIRFQDIRAGNAVLTPADLENRATTEAGFNKHTISSLVERFIYERGLTLALLNSFDTLEDGRTSMHPRLQQAMRVIDLAYFVAEHDDHHLYQLVRT